ncbi:MAG TPA: hypothetical protein VFX02_12185 [Gammaproteobacteria bacterium]|nr:hypothetical protein [Gammaproteobacteria bacterium]
MSEDGKGKQFKETLQMAVIVFTVAWTSYEFFFKEFIKPAHEPTALELDVRLEYAGEKDGLIMVRGVINASNPSNRRIYVPAEWLTVKGRRIAAPTQRGNRDNVIPDSPAEPGVYRNYAPVASSEIVAEQRMLDGIDNNWWDPKDRTNDEISFAIPKGEFDFLDIVVAYLYTKNVDGLADPEWTLTHDGSQWAHFKFANPDTEKNQAKWLNKNDAGFSWSSASLSLWEKH